MDESNFVGIGLKYYVGDEYMVEMKIPVGGCSRQSQHGVSCG